jgi:hypothetical protein
MKRVKIFNTISEFEEYVNRADIDVLAVDIKIVDQSIYFQEYFAAVLYYKELTKSPVLPKITKTINQIGR